MLRARDGSVLGRGDRYVAAALGPGRATRLIDSGGQLLLSCWMVTALAPCQSLGTGGRRTGSSRTVVALEGPVRPLRVRTSDPRARAPGSGRRRQLGGALPASGPGGQTPVLGTHVKPHSSVRGVHCRTGAGVPAPRVASGSWSPRCAFTGRWRLPGRRLRVWSGTRGAHGHTPRSASRCDEGPWSDLTPSGCCVGGSGACGEEQTLQPGPEPAGDPPARRRGARRGVLGPGGRRGPGSRLQAPSRRRGLSAPPRPPAPASVSTRRCPPTLRRPGLRTASRARSCCGPAAPGSARGLRSALLSRHQEPLWPPWPRSLWC